MGDEHLDTIPATESDEVIKSSVEDLVPIPSESEGENGCDVPSSFTTFSNILFDADYDFESVDDQSLHNEDVSEKIFLNPLFEEEIISIKKNQHHFKAESDLVESMLNRDSSIISFSSKIDSLLDEFAQHTLLKSIPPGIDKTECHPENEIRLSQRLLYDNSSPRPPEEFNSENSYAEIEYFSPSPIPNEDKLVPSFDSILQISTSLGKRPSDDQSLSDEDFSKKIYSNPLFDEETIPMEIDQHSFNAESDLIESMPNHDSSIIISSNIDSLFDEFAGKLTLLKSIPSGIDETDCHPEEEIRLTKRLLYDNSSPRPSKKIVSDNSNADIESFSPSPIPNEDSDSHMEEIYLSFNPDDPMPPGIEDDDYDSGRDVPILEELLDNYSLSLPANESYHFDIPSPYRPPAKPPDGNT
nr:hypothetical protein [Tanacetum cinerariifolium]